MPEPLGTNLEKPQARQPARSRQCPFLTRQGPRQYETKTEDHRGKPEVIWVLGHPAKPEFQICNN